MPKSKICIKNLIITDIPSRSNRIFLKLKSGRNSVLSNKYQIGVDNKVAFDDIIIIEYDFEKTKKGCSEKLRFSFRIEKSNGTDFKRYGSFNITDLDYNKLRPQPYLISRNLEKCKEKPKVSCEISLMDYSTKVQKEVYPVTFSIPITPKGNHRRTESSAPCIKNVSPLVKNINRLHLSDVSSKSDSNRKSDPICLCIDEDGKTCSVSSYSSLSTSISKSIPLSISQEKYDELEKNIDDLLAEIINGNFQE